MSTNKIQEFLAKNPKLTTKKETVKKSVEPVSRDKYGCKANGTGAVVNQVISDFVQAGAVHAITPKAIFGYMAAEGTTLKESKIKGHVAWFNKNFTFKGSDFVRNPEPVVYANAPVALPDNRTKVYRNTCHLAK